MNSVLFCSSHTLICCLGLRYSAVSHERAVEMTVFLLSSILKHRRGSEANSFMDI